MPCFTAPPVALSVAGSDCSAGAGIQADLKTFTHFQVYGLTAVTCVVSEIPGKVSQILPCGADLVADQLRLLFAGFPIAAAKTGMLFQAEIIQAVAEALRALPADKRPALVVDPVMIATSGTSLVTADAVVSYEDLLFPLASLLTPNMDEAGVLLGQKITEESELEPAAEALAKKYDCAVLLKGGHLRQAQAVDVLFQKNRPPERYSAPFVPGFSTHGTGCTYSAAITAGLAMGKDLPAATSAAKAFVTHSIVHGCRWENTQNQSQVDALRHW